MTIELANRLAELRKQKGLSQEELADKLQVSRQAISKWERGEASPDTDNLIELAKIYDVSLDELVGLSSPKEKKEEKEPAKDQIIINDDEIHITDDEGNKVEIKDHKVTLTDEEGNTKVITHPSPRHKAMIAISSIVTLLVVIAYLLLGSLLDLWAKAWVLFLLVVVIPSFFEAILKRRMNRFNYPVFLAFIYLLLNIWVLSTPLWHPLWVMFITIPIFYTIGGLFKHHDEDVVVEKEKFNDDGDDDNDSDSDGDQD